MPKSCLQLHFKSHLTGAQEVPPVDADGCGTLELWFNTGFTKVDYKLKVNKTKLVTQAHLHLGKAGFVGSVIATLLDNGGTAAGPPAPGFKGCTQGTLTHSDLTVAAITIADLYQKIRDGEVYVNVHTQNNPTGEVRGQVFAN